MRIRRRLSQKKSKNRQSLPLWKRFVEEWRSKEKGIAKNRHRRNRKNRIWNFDRHLILKEIGCLLFWIGGAKIECI